MERIHVNPPWRRKKELIKKLILPENCAERPNILFPRRPKVSVIDVTAKTMHERLVLVTGRSSTPFLSSCPWRPHSHHFTLLLILEILNLSRKGPPSKKIICFQPVVKVTSPGTLRGSWGLLENRLRSVPTSG